ncbi:MAG: Bug family tripartite tricarboxylate transporter substrate binding protein [Tagaea sp.]
MMIRRDFLKTTLAAGAAAGLAMPVSAQNLERLRMYIPAAPGGGWDQTGRTIEQVMRAAGIVQNFQFENVPGAGGAVGLPRFLGMRGQGDVMMVAGMVMVGSLIANKSPVKITDATPLARLTGEFQVVVVPANSPHRDMRSLAAAVRANPGAVSWAGGSAGGTDHILVGMIGQALGVEPRQMSYVAFAGGGPAQAALLGGQTTAGVSGWGEFAEQVKSGRLRAIGLSSPDRQAGIDVPTLKEQGIDVELFNWRGVFGTPGINANQRTALIGLVDRMVRSSQWKEEVAKRDWTEIYQSGDDFGRYVAAEVTRIEGVLRSLGLAT